MHLEYLPTTASGRAARLIEECGEVLLMMGKIGRFGLESRHPDGGPRNYELLLSEMSDLKHALHEFESDILQYMISRESDATNPVPMFIPD